MLRPQKRMADIGTDHAYLPIWAVRQGLTSYAIASDINQGPLDAALRNVIRYHTEGKMELRRSNGLQGFSPQDADDIVIAGMGGELIAKILAEASWLKDPEKRLILQPMTSPEELRLFLGEEGYCVRKEPVVEDGGRIYAVMLVEYTGEKTQPDDLYLQIGKVAGDTDEEKKYLKNRAILLQKRAQGLRIQGLHADAEHLFAVEQEILRRAGLVQSAEIDEQK